MFRSATGLDPFVHLVLLELPEAAHAMRGHFMFINPLAHGVIAACCPRGTCRSRLSLTSGLPSRPFLKLLVGDWGQAMRPLTTQPATGEDIAITESLTETQRHKEIN